MGQHLESVNPKELVIVGLDTEDGVAHPLWDERIKLSVKEELVASILAYGVRVPVLVREEDGKLFVVDGRQRVRAAREAGVRDPGAPPKVPYILQHGDDNRMSSVMVLTNEQRVDDPIITKARKAVRLFERLGDVDEVAIIMGRTSVTIRNWLSLMKAHPDVLAAVEQGTISTAAGIELSRMTREEQETQLKATLAATEARTAPPPLTEGNVKEARQKTGAVRTHAGVRRSWLRSALKTKAAEELNEEQRSVLHWFVEGTADSGEWFDTFQIRAQRELEQK